MKEIRTSQPDWLPRLFQSYETREAFQFIDDRGFGVDLTRSLFVVSLRAGLSLKEWFAVLAALGITGFGAFMVVVAILDPEPISKLGLLIAAGAVLFFTGSVSILKILVGLHPPNVTVSPTNGVVISWER